MGAPSLAPCLPRAVPRQVGCDVFNCLDIMDNKKFLKDLKFAVGDGALQYYLYNWRCPQMEPEKLGMVLL